MLLLPGPQGRGVEGNEPLTLRETQGQGTVQPGVPPGGGWSLLPGVLALRLFHLVGVQLFLLPQMGGLGGLCPPTGNMVRCLSKPDLCGRTGLAAVVRRPSSQWAPPALPMSRMGHGTPARGATRVTSHGGGQGRGKCLSEGEDWQ